MTAKRQQQQQQQHQQQRYGDVVGETLGDWGKWQLRTVLLIFLCKLPACWCMTIVIFTAPSPRQLPIRCSLAAPANATITSAATANMSESNINNNRDDHQRPLLPPPPQHTTFVMHPTLIEPNDKQFDIDYCDVRLDVRAHATARRIEWTAALNGARPGDFSDDDAADDDDDYATIIPCDALTHRPFYYLKETMFDVICSRNLVAAFTQLFHLLGVLSGGLIALALMTFISPKNVMLCGMLGQIVCGCLLAFIDVFWLQCVMRWLCSISCAQMYTAGTVIFTDITGGKYRTYVTCLFDMFWSIGAITIPIITYYAQSWRNTYLAISLPTCAYVIGWYFIGDSPRWHMQNGNYDRAARILIEAATMNETAGRLHDDLYVQLREARRVRPATVDAGSKCAWLRLWCDSETRWNAACLHVAWGVFITNLNGLLLNTRAFGNDAVHWNVAMTGCSEIVGIVFGIIFIVDSKRKWLRTGLLNILGGVAVLFLSAFSEQFSHNTNPVLVFTAALLIKVVTSMTEVLLLSSTAELVAPEYRKSLMLSCTICGRLCLLSASFIGSLTLVSAVRPFVVFTLMGTLGGFALCLVDASRKRASAKKPIEMDEMRKLTDRDEGF